MSFFLSKSAMGLKSMFDISSNTNAEEDQIHLDDASAIQRILFTNEGVRPVIEGVVAFTVKSATLLQLDRDFLKLRNTYCTCINRNYSKKTRVVLNSQGQSLIWDETMHFPVHVIRNERHPFNFIKLQLFGFSTQDMESHQQIGSVSFHIHDIIHASPLAGTYDLWNKNVHIGDLNVEITFSYGAYGYGYSFQLQEDDVKPTERIQYSLFPRINPRYNECEPEEAFLEFKSVPVPKILQSYEPAQLSCAKEMMPLNPPEELYVPETLMKEMTNMEAIRNKYYSMSDRASRLMFLSGHLHQMRNVNETVLEASEIPQEAAFPSKVYKSFVEPTLYQMTKTSDAENGKLARSSSIRSAFRDNKVMDRIKTGSSEMLVKKKASVTGKVAPQDAPRPSKWSFFSIGSKDKTYPET